MMRIDLTQMTGITIEAMLDAIRASVRDSQAIIDAEQESITRDAIRRCGAVHRYQRALTDGERERVAELDSSHSLLCDAMREIESAKHFASIGELVGIKFERREAE